MYDFNLLTGNVLLCNIMKVVLHEKKGTFYVPLRLAYFFNLSTKDVSQTPDLHDYQEFPSPRNESGFA